MSIEAISPHTIQQLAEDLLPWINAYQALCEEKEIPEVYKLRNALSDKIEINFDYVENIIHQKLRVIGTIGGYDLLYAVHQDLKKRLNVNPWYLLVYDRNANGIAGWIL